VVPIPIFRAELTVYHRASDGEWDTDGPMPNWLFYPFPDEDGTERRESGFRRVARGGWRPACTVLAPDGSELVGEGYAARLKVPGVKGTLDAFTARLNGLHRRHGFDLERQITVAFGPCPEHPPAPTRQLAMSFND
jgi:hypothetical protein